MHARRHIAITVVSLTIISARPAGAIEPQLLRAIPQEHLAAILLDQTGAAQPAATQPADQFDFLSVATNMLRQLRAAGVIGSGDGGLLIDVVTSMAVLSDHPYAIVVTNAAARDLPDGGHRLANLQLAVIVLTRGDNAALTQQIQTLLSARTNEAHSHITTHDDNGVAIHSLTDDRLPDWATMHWAPVGDFYVAALGDAAMKSACETILGRRPDATQDAWFASNHAKTHGRQAQIEWDLQLAQIQQRLANVLGDQVHEVLTRLEFGNTERGLWTIARRGRAIVATAAYQTDSSVRIEHISRELEATDPDTAVIPAESDAYAIVPHAPAALIRHATNAYLTARSPKSADVIRNAWQEFEQQAGLDVDHALLAHMGDRIIIHTYPRHPLNIPLLCTILVPIEGPTRPVRDALDALMNQVNRWLGRVTADEEASAFAPRMHRDADIWYIQAGIYGPAVTVIDGWMVISFSPDAVRRCARKMKAQAVNTKTGAGQP